MSITTKSSHPFLYDESTFSHSFKQKRSPSAASSASSASAKKTKKPWRRNPKKQSDKPASRSASASSKTASRSASASSKTTSSKTASSKTASSKAPRDRSVSPKPDVAPLKKEEQKQTEQMHMFRQSVLMALDQIERRLTLLVDMTTRDTLETRVRNELKVHTAQLQHIVGSVRGRIYRDSINEKK